MSFSYIPPAEQLKFGKIWYKLITNPKDEYIVGSQLIHFVEEMKHLGKDGDMDHSYISQDMLVSVSNFSHANPDVKIYKFAIDDYLRNLLGFTFHQYLEMIEGKDEVNDKERNVGNNGDLPVIIAKEDINHDKETNKDSGEDGYKRLYELLQKEYLYYKTIHPDDSRDSSLGKDSINFDLLASEIKNHIKEQREIMLNISHNVENRQRYDNVNSTSKTNINNNTPKDTKTNTDKGTNWRVTVYNFAQIIFIGLVAVMFSYILSSFIIPSKTQEFDDDTMDGMNIMFESDPWWTRYNKLNQFIWKVHDWYTDIFSTKHNNNMESSTAEPDIKDAYDEIFGLI